MHNDKFRELLENFIGTETVSPALLELLEQRLDTAIGHEIDAEIERRHALLVHHPRSRSTAADQQYFHSRHRHNSRQKLLLAEFGFTDSKSFSSSSPSTSQSQNGTMHQTQHDELIQRISDQLVAHSYNLKKLHAELFEESKHLVQRLWQIGHEKDRRKGKKTLSGTVHQQTHLNECILDDTFSPHFLPPMTIAAGGDGQQNGRQQQRENGDEENSQSDSGDAQQEHNTVAVELSTFSLDHSMQEWPDEELQNIVWLICSDGMEQSVRLVNIRKLHFVSPFAFAKSKAFEIFLGHLHAILPFPLLFSETMHVLARILNCPNEIIWLKSSDCLSRVAHGVMRSPSLGPNDKKSFADFFRQLLCYGPQIWRSFDQSVLGQIVQHFVEMLTVEVSAVGAGGPSTDGFLALLARVDPEAQWLLPWLHRRSIFMLMIPKFLELINEIVDHHGGAAQQLSNRGDDKVFQARHHCPLFWAFEASVLFRCLQRSHVFGFLSEMVSDRVGLRHAFCRAILHFLTLAFVPPSSVVCDPRPKGFGLARRIVVQGLLETTTTDCGTAMLCSMELFLRPLFVLSSSVGAPLLAKVSSTLPSTSSSSSSHSPQFFDLCLKVLLNVLLYTPPSSLSSSVDSLRLSPPFLTLVEQSLRHHLTLFIHHNDNPFSNDTVVQLLPSLCAHFPMDQIRAVFADLCRTLLVPHMAKLDLSDQTHRRLLLSVAYLTFMDDKSSAYQWCHWRKSVGKMLNKIALRNYSRIGAETFSPTIPSDEWATFPSPIELGDSEKHWATNALLQFLGLQQNGEKMLGTTTTAHHHHQRQKQKSDLQNNGTIKPKKGQICPSAAHTHSTSICPICEIDITPKLFSDDGDGDCSHFGDNASSSHHWVHYVDFLASAPTEFRRPFVNCHSGDEPLPRFIFFLITQPELLVELFRSGQFGHFLLKQFAAFERLKDSEAEERLNEFIGKMDFLITNFDALTDLRHFVPNLGARLVELLHKYCSSSSDNLLISELGKRLLLFLSHSVVASPAERHFSSFDNTGQIRTVLAGIPKSLYRSRREEKRRQVSEAQNGADEQEEEEEEKDEEGEEVWSVPTKSDCNSSSAAVDQLQHNNDEKAHFPHSDGAALTNPMPATAVVLPRNCSIVSIALEEADRQFWFALLPERDTVATRHALLRALFSASAAVDGGGKTLQHKRMANVRPFELLHKFATKFWPFPEQKRMTVRPPQHSEWLSVLADYAHGLGLMVGSRATVRKRMGSIRMLQLNGANDWFLAALFLSSGLSSEATSDFCERLLEQRHSSCGTPLGSFPSLDSVWPACCYSASSSAFCAPSSLRPFPELLGLRVFPRALSLLRQCPVFRPLSAFLSSCQLPSLFHLLLFYTNQSYIGILPFRAVQEYLVLAVLGGPQFQALHFCAVLAHIFHCSSSTRHHSLHFSSKLTSLFLRPNFLGDFHFSKYALLEMDDEEAQ